MINSDKTDVRQLENVIYNLKAIDVLIIGKEVT